MLNVHRPAVVVPWPPGLPFADAGCCFSPVGRGRERLEAGVCTEEVGATVAMLDLLVDCLARLT